MMADERRGDRTFNLRYFTLAPVNSILTTQAAVDNIYASAALLNKAPEILDRVRMQFLA